jgi:hypothetical protein
MDLPAVSAVRDGIVDLVKFSRTGTPLAGALEPFVSNAA